MRDSQKASAQFWARFPGRPSSQATASTTTTMASTSGPHSPPRSAFLRLTANGLLHRIVTHVPPPALAELASVSRAVAAAVAAATAKRPIASRAVRTGESAKPSAPSCARPCRGAASPPPSPRAALILTRFSYDAFYLFDGRPRRPWWNVRVGWTDARNAALSLVVARIALRHFLVYEPTLPKADDPFYGATLVELAVVTDNLPLLVAIVQTRRAWARAAPAGRLQPHFDHLFSFAAGAGALTIVRYFLSAHTSPHARPGTGSIGNPHTDAAPPVLPLYPPFSAACECGRSETVREFLAHPTTSPPFVDTLFPRGGYADVAASGDPDLIDLLHARVPTSTLSPAENNCEALIAAVNKRSAAVLARLLALPEIQAEALPDPLDGVPAIVFPPRAENIVMIAATNGDLPVLDVALKSIRTSPQTSRTAAADAGKCAPLAHLQARVSGWLMYGFVEACWENPVLARRILQSGRLLPKDEVRARSILELRYPPRVKEEESLDVLYWDRKERRRDRKYRNQL
ncbi:hypothetical protein DFJ73DRAFT_892622 [Zopfochytrium polystomum]|nr:hypothetical protein DFJ73DRAFT_892622 [Zopfochytrium polystomum]